MTLTINGKPYEVSREQGRIRLETSTASYTVDVGPERTTCDCPDYRYRHADLPYSDGCKHIRAIANIL